MSLGLLLPKPDSWECLEASVCDIAQRKYGNYNFQRYGRSGQKQDGVDIVGLYENGFIGIQCKNHPESDISEGEISSEITKSDAFRPSLSEYMIVTSAKRDTNTTKYVLEISNQRINNGKFPVSIKFWEDICDWLLEFPELIYKHFPGLLNLDQLTTPKYPGLISRKISTLEWPFSSEDVHNNILTNLGGIDLVSPYQLSVGISTFRDQSFDRQIDLLIPLADIVEKETDTQVAFKKTCDILNELASVILSLDLVSKDLVLYVKTHLTYAYLIGWIFRKVSGFSLVLPYNDQVWTTKSFQTAEHGLLQELPIQFGGDKNEIAIALNISRNVSSSMEKFLENWSEQPKFALAFTLESKVVVDASQALAIAHEVSSYLKNIIDRWMVEEIHLFSALPAPLATLIGHNLNAICPISLFYLDETRSNYLLGGTVNNSL